MLIICEATVINWLSCKCILHVLFCRSCAIVKGNGSTKNKEQTGKLFKQFVITNPCTQYNQDKQSSNIIKKKKTEQKHNLKISKTHKSFRNITHARIFNWENPEM